MQIDIQRAWGRLQFNDTARLRLYRKIAKMLSNGLPLLKILDELYDRASHHGKKPNVPLALLLADSRHMVQNGHLLSESFEGWVPRTEQMILMAGEQAGRLDQTLRIVTQVTQAQKKIKKAVVGGILYPTIVLMLVLMYLYLFGTRVIPEFARMVNPESWRGVARSLYLMSQLVQQWMVPIVIAIIMLVTLILVSMPRWRGNVRVFFDRFAPYSVYRLMAGSGFLMAFSALQFAGITVEKSLMRLSDMASPWLRERLDGALLGVKSGLNCGEALRNTGYGFPSDEVIDDLCVYSDYKGFAEALKVLADEWMEDGIEQISVQMKVLNGFAIVTLAVVIAWLAAGFFGIQQEIASMTRVIR